MDDLERTIVNRLQGGFPVSERPFLDAGRELGLTEEELIARIGQMLANGTLTRFGPMYQIERMGGVFTLAALQAPEDDYERVTRIVNGHSEVAHNYRREHALNMWFVIAADSRAKVARVIRDIEQESGLEVLEFPKLREYFVDMRLAV